MHCVDCDASIRVRHNQTVAYDFGGLPDVSLCGIDVRVCDNGHRDYVLPRRDELHQALTHALVVKPTRLMPCEVKFMLLHGPHQVASKSTNTFLCAALAFASASSKL